jgi:hypothetical protein
MRSSRLWQPIKELDAGGTFNLHDNRAAEFTDELFGQSEKILQIRLPIP